MARLNTQLAELHSTHQGSILNKDTLQDQIAGVKAYAIAVKKKMDDFTAKWKDTLPSSEPKVKPAYDAVVHLAK